MRQTADEVLFTSLAQVRQALRAWKEDYNKVRPHSAIGNIPPAIYTAISAPEKQRAGTLALVEDSAPNTVAQQPEPGSNAELPRRSQGAHVVPPEERSD